MSFNYVFGNIDHIIQLALLGISLILAIAGVISSNPSRSKKLLGFAVITVIVYLMFMQFELVSYNIGQSWAHNY
ncbi:MAG: hypothetical protein J5685_07210 [Clostridiales bacterium]|nr:hypothetical protein [Clostridiales bacterium]